MESKATDPVMPESLYDILTAWQSGSLAARRAMRGQVWTQSEIFTRRQPAAACACADIYCRASGVRCRN